MTALAHHHIPELRAGDRNRTVSGSRRTHLRRTFPALLTICMLLPAAGLHAQVAVTPDGGTDTTMAQTSGNTVEFYVEIYQGHPEFKVECGVSGSATSCTPDQDHIMEGLLPVPDAPDVTIQVDYAAGDAGSGQVTLYVYDASCSSYDFCRGDKDTGYYDVTVESGNFAPTLSLSPHNGGYLDMRRCAVACFDVTAAYSTPAYTSMDVPRSATLIYRSSQAHPITSVVVDAEDPQSATPPEKMSIRLKRPDGSWVSFLNGSDEIFYSSGSGKTRLVAAFDATGLSTGAYNYTVVVRSWWSDGTSKESTASIRILITNEADSPFGAGWTLAGLQRIHVHGDSVVVTEGDGSVAFFARTGCPSPSACEYTSPAGDFTTLTGGDGYGYTRTYPDGTELSFSAAGRLQSAQDRFGNTISYGRDGSGRLTSIQDPAGQQIDLAYGGDGKLAYIDGAGGRRSTVTIDADGDLTHIHDPGGEYAIQASYDAEHRMTDRTDRRGGDWDVSYSYAGKIETDTLPTVTLHTGANTRPVVSYRSLQDHVLADVAAGNGTSSSPAKRYKPGQAKAKITDARGNSKTMRLNEFGLPYWVKDPLGRVTKQSWNSDRLPRNTRTVSGDTTVLEWDGPDLVKITNKPTGRTVHLAYEPQYHEVDSIWGDTRKVRNYWSGGTLDSVRIGSSSSVTRFYHAADGRIDSILDPEGHQTYFYYSGSGYENTDSVIDAVRRTAYDYDGYGRRTTVVNPVNDTTRIHQDAINRDTLVVDAAGGATRFVYDALYLTKVVDPRSQSYDYTRNALGWVTTRTDPAGAGEQYAYDANGNVREWTNRRQQSTTYTYDAVDRMLTRAAGADTTSFGYDPDNRWIAVSRGSSTDTVRYDEQGRPIESTTVRGGTTYTLESSYNVRGRRTDLTMTAPWSRSIEYRYNPVMLLDTLVDLSNGVTSISYNADLQAVDATLPNGLAISEWYPSTHRPGEIAYSTQPVDDAAGLELRYDDLKRIDEHRHAKSGGDSVRVFGYDEVGRLTSYDDYFMSDQECYEDDDYGSWCFGGDEQWLAGESLAYDAVGNRTDNGAVVGSANRLIEFGTDSLVYDDAGNVTELHRSGSLHQLFYWSRLNQLDSVWTSGVGTVRFDYDGFGRRIQKWTDSDTIQYLYDDEDLFMELDGGGSTLREYTYYPGTDRPHSVRTGGQTYYYAVDIPGSVRGLVQDSATVVNEYRYTPFGAAEYTSESVTNPLRYAGREYDSETGLYYMRARYYSPSLARFISEDPIGLAGGLNPYVYVGNSPMNGRDPFGLDHCEPHVEIGSPTVVDPEDPENSGGGTSGENQLTYNPDCDHPGALDAAAADYITLGLGVSWEGVDPILHSAVVRTALQLSQPLHVSSTTGGDHSDYSAHYDGQAVDINRVDGVRFKEMPGPTAFQLGETIADMVASYLPQHRLRELIGPGFAVRYHKGLWPPDDRAGLIRSHRDHVHVSILP